MRLMRIEQLFILVKEKSSAKLPRHACRKQQHAIVRNRFPDYRENISQPPKQKSLRPKWTEAFSLALLAVTALISLHGQFMASAEASQGFFRAFRLSGCRNN